jgi:hypothetical protein
VFDSDSNSLRGTPNLGSPGNVTFLFSDFSSSIDFTDVRGIEMEIVGSTGAGADVSISSVVVVPEPSAALLLAFGLAGLAARRRH